MKGTFDNSRYSNNSLYDVYVNYIMCYFLSYYCFCVWLLAEESCLGDAPRCVSYIFINGALLIFCLKFQLFRHFIKLQWNLSITTT